MKQIWAPWRLEYVQGEKASGCIFCAALADPDARRSLIVARGQRCFVIMNRFPYNTGHVMIVPNRHRSRLDDLDDQELGELFRYTDYCVRAQERVLRPEGYNIGMNLGRAAGAGIDDHLHIHVVPRWAGDTNFMPVLGDVKVIPEHLQATHGRLTDGFAAVLAEGPGRAEGTR